MKVCRTTAVLVALCIVSLFAAHDALAGAEPGDLGIFADPTGTRSEARIVVGEPLSVYIVAYPPPEGIRAFEVAVRAPIGVVLGWTVLPEHPSRTPLGQDAWLVSLRYCAVPPTPIALVELQVIALAPVTDAALCLGRLENTGLGALEDGVPAYASCVSGTPVAFGIAQNGAGHYPNGCLILNATMQAPVDNEPFHMGTVKSWFGSRTD